MRAICTSFWVIVMGGVIGGGVVFGLCHHRFVGLFVVFFLGIMLKIVFMIIRILSI